MFSIHLVGFTARTLDGRTEHGIARVATEEKRPTLRDCLQAIPGFLTADYLGPEPRYRLRWRTEAGIQERRTNVRGVERIGRFVNRLADRGDAWGIEVLDDHDEDVTFNFGAFRV